LTSLARESWGGWALSGRSILYTDTGLQALDLETGKTRTISPLLFPPAPWDRSMGVSPDGRYALVTELERQGSEIHLLPER